MATDLATPSNTLAKVRWREQYVSEGLNKKLNGLVPHGVIRGGRLGTNALDLRVTVEADPDAGDSIYSVIDANGHQLTFREAGDTTLDLTALASTTVYVGLEVIYSISAVTTVKWRAYSQAEIDADPTIVCLGGVDVPASGVIAETSILGDRRTDGATVISAGMRPWRQVIQNPSFEGGEVSVSALGESRAHPGWYLQGGSWGSTLLATPSSTLASQPRTGDNNLYFRAASVADGFVAFPTAAYRVSPGQMVKASVWVRGDSVVWGGGSTKVGIRLTARQWDGALVTAPSPWSSGVFEIVDDGTLIVGTVGYTELSGVVKMPADAAFLDVRLIAQDSTNMAGDIGFDDFRLWLEGGALDTPYDLETDVVGGEPFTSGLIASPWLGQNSVVDPGDLVERAVRLACEDATAGGLEYAWKPIKDAVTSFLMSLPKGRLDLGSGLNSSDAERVIPRISTDNFAGLANDYVLLWEMNPTGGTFTDKVRVYTGVAFSLLSAYRPIIITVNASWNGTNWSYDDSGTEATRIELGQYGIYFYSRDAGSTSPWVDGDWTDPANNSYEFFSVYNNTNGNAEVVLNNAIISINNQGIETNPANTTEPLPNSLYAKNICKGWAYVQANGATLTILDGFNIGAVQADVNFEFTLLEDMADTNYCVVCSGGLTTTNVRLLMPVVEDNSKGLGTFEMAAYTFDAITDTISFIDADTVSGPTEFYIALYGEQDS